jgi:hypothetical protein
VGHAVMHTIVGREPPPNIPIIVIFNVYLYSYTYSEGDVIQPLFLDV